MLDDAPQVELTHNLSVFSITFKNNSSLLYAHKQSPAYQIDEFWVWATRHPVHCFAQNMTCVLTN